MANAQARMLTLHRATILLLVCMMQYDMEAPCLAYTATRIAFKACVGRLQPQGIYNNFKKMLTEVDQYAQEVHPTGVSTLLYAELD